MKIKVDFFKTGGKWYASCEIDVESQLREDSFMQEVVNKQNAMMEGWQGHYFIVISDTATNELDPNYKSFYNRHYMSWDWLGIKRKNL